MKILEIIFDLSPGGAERFVVDLCNEIAQTNYVVLCTLKNDSKNEMRTFYKAEVQPEVQYKCLGLSDGISLRKMWTIHQFIKNEHADVVHLHGWGIPFFCLIAIILQHKKTKFYQTIHNDLDNGYKNPMYKFLFKCLSTRDYYHFIALSKKNFNQVKAFSPNCCAICIENGRAPIYPTPLFKVTQAELEKYKLHKESLLFIHVARFADDKNQQLLINAFNKFVEQNYDADLIIIGSGFGTPEGILLQQQSCTRIHFLGAKKNISDYLLNADVFCLSSKFEGLPISLIEASLAGVPAISTPVGGVAEIIKHRQTGFITKDLTQNEYLSALIWMYTHFNTIKQNSIQAKKHSIFTIQNCGNKYLNFFANDRPKNTSIS